MKMLFNKGVFVAGLILALAAAAGVFFLGMAMAPPPAIVMAARVPLPIDMPLSQMVEEDVVPVKIRTDNGNLSSYVSPEDFQAMKAAGGILIADVTPGEFLRRQDIVSPANYMSANLTALALVDPSKVVVLVKSGGTSVIPNGIRAGDYVDLVLAIDEIPQSKAEEMPDYSGLQYGGLTGNDAGGSLGGIITPQGTMIIAGKEYAPHGGEVMTEDGLQDEMDLMAPIAQRIVSNAQVVRINREGVLTYSNQGASSYAGGSITGLELVIDRNDAVLLAMAQSTGTIYFSLLSPVVEAEAPGEGTGMRDYIDAYLKDHPINEDNIEYMPTLPAPTPTPDAGAPLSGTGESLNGTGAESGAAESNGTGEGDSGGFVIPSLSGTATP